MPKIELTGKQSTSKKGYQVHETNNGKLIIFPGVKRKPQELIEFINRWSKKIKDYRTPLGESIFPVTIYPRLFRRFLLKRKGLILKTKKPNSSSAIPEMQEATMLKHLKKFLAEHPEIGYKSEEPIAVHLTTKGKQHMITTFGKGLLVKGIPSKVIKKLEDGGFIVRDPQQLAKSKTIIDIEQWELKRGVKRP